MHLSPSANDSVHLSGWSQIAKVDHLKYIGSYIYPQLDIKCRIAQTWVNAFDNKIVAALCNNLKKGCTQMCFKAVLRVATEMASLPAVGREFHSIGSSTNKVRRSHTSRWDRLIFNTILSADPKDCVIV